MLIKSISNAILILLLICFSTVKAQDQNCNATTLADFFDCYGGVTAFNNHAIDATTAFIEAEDAIKQDDFTLANTIVNTLFTTYPKGNAMWYTVFTSPNGSNIGTPAAYYGLRMLEEIIDYNLNFIPPSNPEIVKMNVILAGNAQGVQPTTITELQNGTGPFVNKTLDPNLLTNNYFVLEQSTELFSSYVTAITEGKINLEINYIELPNLTLDVEVTTTEPYIARAPIDTALDALSEDLKNDTDWFWIISPSFVPEQPVFDNEAFISGGITQDDKGGPVFIIDDKWMIRKPAHLGSGLYSDIERRIYLPQWLQHEFFHHLYAKYPALNLEVNGHDWFDLSFWPADFEGIFEADYYAETLHKRIKVDCEPLHEKLVTRLTAEQNNTMSSLAVDDIVEEYSLDVVLNPWHEGEILFLNGNYYWRNAANVQWQVSPDFSNGRLETGADSPYPGQDFFIEIYKNLNGDYFPAITGLNYQGEFYRRRTNMINDVLPVEIFVNTYNRVPTENTSHTGAISKLDGLFYWQNDAGASWDLLPDTANTIFNLNNTSPTPNDNFELVIINDSCELIPLGFTYDEYYYWKPKINQQNQSPQVTSAIPNLVLPLNFNSHSIGFADTFVDAENDELFYFATSTDSSLLNVSITNEEIILNGNQEGSVDVYLMALDRNGGLAFYTFNVLVTENLGINDDFLSNHPVNVYPNPTKNMLTLETSFKFESLKIYNLLGQEMKIAAREVKPNVYNINLTHLASNIYFMELKRGNLKMIRKIIKKDF